MFDVLYISAFAVLYFIEGYGDSVDYSLYTKSSQKEIVKKSHRISWVHNFFIALISSAAYIRETGDYFNLILLMIVLGFLRMLVLNSTMNLLKHNRKIYYLGETSVIDVFIQKFIYYAVLILTFGKVKIKNETSQIIFYVMLVVLNILIITYFLNR